MNQNQLLQWPKHAVRQGPNSLVLSDLMAGHKSWKYTVSHSFKMFPIDAFQGFQSQNWMISAGNFQGQEIEMTTSGGFPTN
jgi:hypothetical protein